MATCRLKQAGCELPGVRVVPSLADTTASISAKLRRFCERGFGANEGDAILCSLLYKRRSWAKQKIIASMVNPRGTFRPHHPDHVKPTLQLFAKPPRTGIRSRSDTHPA